MRILSSLLPAAASPFHAHGYATKPGRLILTNPSGGAVDVIACSLSDELARTLGLRAAQRVRIAKP